MADVFLTLLVEVTIGHTSLEYAYLDSARMGMSFSPIYFPDGDVAENLLTIWKLTFDFNGFSGLTNYATPGASLELVRTGPISSIRTIEFTIVEKKRKLFMQRSRNEAAIYTLEDGEEFFLVPFAAINGVKCEDHFIEECRQIVAAPISSIKDKKTHVWITRDVTKRVNPNPVNSVN